MKHLVFIIGMILCFSACTFAQEIQQARTTDGKQITIQKGTVVESQDSKTPVFQKISSSLSEQKAQPASAQPVQTINPEEVEKIVSAGGQAPETKINNATVPTGQNVDVKTTAAPLKQRPKN